jgi:hypothetical protein
MSFDTITVGGTAISTWAGHARLLKFASGSQRGKNLLIPFRDGEHSKPLKWNTPTTVVLQVQLLHTPNTHLEYLSGLLAALSDPLNLVTLGATGTFHGAVQAKVELMAEPTMSPADPSVWTFRLRNPKGVWEDVTATTNAGNPPAITTTGDRPVDDMEMTFTHVNATASYLEHTDSNSVVSRVTIDSGAATGSYVVDCGARTVLVGATANDAYLTVTQPWWMRFEPNLAQSFTSSVSVSVVWRNKWAI